MNKTIIMIHGMWGGGWYWENYKNYFEAKGYKCIVPTLRYHDINPKSAPPAELGTTSILDYAADLEKLIKETGGQPIIDRTFHGRSDSADSRQSQISP